MTQPYQVFIAACWFLAIIILMIEPVQWLINTWFDPAYNSQGLMIAGLMIILLLWSLLSPRYDSAQSDKSTHKAILLLASTAVIRLAGQFLAINMLSALALVIDIYALGLLLGLNHRKHALSPAWLALLFAFSLPIERILQRILGYPLQLFSAQGSCSFLGIFNDNLQCNGVEMLLNHQAVLVDLPCSGARGLIQLLILFCLIGAVLRPTQPQGVQTTIKYFLSGFALLVISAYLGNVLRISTLALGIAYPEFSFGINVMAAPWHDIIGLICLLFSALPLLLWAYYQPKQKSPTIAKKITGNSHVKPIPDNPYYQRVRHWLPLLSPAVVAIAILITMVPKTPLDVIKTDQHIAMPYFLNGFYAKRHPLSAQEKLYFTQYGGNAHKVSYGDFALLQVSTRAPLRHLHDPQDCLSGSGHQVEYMGFSQTPLNAAVYKSHDPQGKQWRIAVTFISNQGHQTTNIAEAIWLWLQQPGSHWTMLQRITPWETPQTQLILWDKALMQAMELNGNNNQTPQPSTGEKNHELI